MHMVDGVDACEHRADVHAGLNDNGDDIFNMWAMNSLHKLQLTMRNALLSSDGWHR